MREIDRSREGWMIEKGGRVIGEALETNHSIGYVGKPVLNPWKNGLPRGEARTNPWKSGLPRGEAPTKSW